jgi:putative membrane protein
MKTTFVMPLLASAVLLFASCDNNSQNDTEENAMEQNEEKHDDTNLENDAEFAVKAASGGMMEVELGKLAVNKAVTPEVKNFGQSMIDDHSAANAELKGVAASKNITLPAGPGEDKQDEIDKLNTKTGLDFDKDYIDFMVKDHKDDIDEFEKEASNGKDADLKNWASGKVPVLRHHLEMAEAIQEGLKKK